MEEGKTVQLQIAPHLQTLLQLKPGQVQQNKQQHTNIATQVTLILTMIKLSELQR